MINVISIISHDGGDGIKIVFTIDDGEKKTTVISADDFLSFGIVKGINEEIDTNKLEYLAGQYAANKAAIRILSFGQCSAKKLYEKLRRRGFSHECAKNASNNAAAKGYIDEEGQIESYLRDLLEKRYIGRRKLLPMLLAKGYSGARIDFVLNSKYSDEDFEKAKKNFLLKKFGKLTPESSQEYEEMRKALYKQGY